MAHLKIEKLCRGWDFPVLDEISLEVAEGEFFVLVGPSGAGKTTTLRLVAGLDTPDQGSIYFSDKDVTKIPPYQRGASMTFESYALYPLLTVYENIASPLRARKLPEEEIKQQVHKIAELLRITELLDRRPNEVSGGQKQRTALGRTLVATPQVFLLDEPLSHLDAKIRIELREQFHQLEELRRTATLYVTHDYAEALSLGDRVGVLADTHIQQIGTPSEIFEKPNSVQVARQFGQPDINLLEVAIEQQEEQLVARAGELNIDVANEYKEVINKTNSSSKLQLGIRPQHLHLDSQGSIDAVVTSFQSLGSYGVLSVKCGDIPLRVLVAPEEKIAEGDKVKLAIDLHSCVWFDANDKALTSSVN